MAKLTDGTEAKAGDLKPGETRTWHARDKDTKEIIKTFVLTRTERDYVYDLCDAYNDARTQDAIERGVEWFVHNGELRIGTSDAWSRANHKRIEQQKQTETTIALRRQFNPVAPKETQ
jgi:hypothetical protein